MAGEKSQKDASETKESGETITFELIRRIQREEQRVPRLTKLPAQFYTNVRTYLKRKQTLDNRKSAIEGKNAERLVEDIFSRRERKIVNAALVAARTGIPPENLTDEEREYFNSILSITKARREGFLDKVVEKPAEQKETAKLIVFKEEVPAFIGVDEKNYGPFKKGDVANLPDQNMQVLIERGVAEELSVTK